MLKGFPAVLRVPLQWGDMDATGQCSPIAIYRHFESARLHYFNSFIASKLSPAVYKGFILGHGVGRILKQASINMSMNAKPRRYPDTLLVGARTVWIDKDRFRQEYVAVSVKEQEITADGMAVIVVYDHLKRCKAMIPEEVVAAMRDIESQSAECSIQ